MKRIVVVLLALFAHLSVFAQVTKSATVSLSREHISINPGWRFYLYDSITKADDLIYDVRPEVNDHKDDKAADARPTEAVKVEKKQEVLKPWILPTGNDFIADSANYYARPDGNPGGDFPFVQNDFDDRSWEAVNLPHDWAIQGPFLKGPRAKVGGGMGDCPAPVWPGIERSWIFHCLMQENRFFLI